MNKAFEKILERLEEKLKKSEERYHRYLDDGNLSCMFDRSDIEEKRVDTIKEMLEIVQEVAEEYNGGWILCSERLPEIGQEVIVSTQNGSMYSNFYYDYTDSKDKEPCFHRWDDEMWDCFKHDVIAWQPLPEPFKERD